MRQVAVHGIHAHFDRRLVEVDVTGFGHSVLEINPAVPRPLPVAPDPATLIQSEMPRIPDGVIPGGRATVEGGDRKHGLEG